MDVLGKQAPLDTRHAHLTLECFILYRLGAGVTEELRIDYAGINKFLCFQDSILDVRIRDSRNQISILNVNAGQSSRVSRKSNAICSEDG